jgi:T3SS negative regulator,GrlR
MNIGERRFKMEGFWTVQFTGVQGWGAGVVTLIHGRVFGGDSAFLYTGTYTADSNNLNAKIQVRRFAQGMGNVMGRDQFELELTGTLKGNTITATGSIPGTPLKLTGTLTKQADLPK